MIYEHGFLVRAPLSAVSQFHSRTSALVRLTPPPIVLRPDRPGANINDVSFTMWIGPLPVRWIARITDARPAGFTDTQVVGPFARWVHQHSFVEKGDDATEVVDRVDVRLSWRPDRLAIGLAMWLGLPALFAYRARATRRALTASCLVNSS